MPGRFPGFLSALVAVSLCWLCVPVLHAANGIRELPSTPQLRSAPATDYALRASTIGGVPVTLIDVQAGTGDWIKPDASHIAAPSAMPMATAKDPPQWFYGATVGWMAVPAGWRVQRAVIGADGNTFYTFAAPEGAASGWVTYALIPACVACVLREAEGLLPDVSEHLNALNSDAQAAHPAQTNPVMDWQSHPDDCTALFRYRTGGLSVRAVVLTSAPVSVLDSKKGELSLAEVYVAMPASTSALPEAIVGRFQQSFVACHAPNGWSG